jgi:hypothetical protein
MNADQVIKKAEENYSRVSKTQVDGVTGLFKTEEGWVILLEAIERRAIPDTMDVLGLYEVRVDSEGNLLGFERKKLRKRGETEEK